MLAVTLLSAFVRLASLGPGCEPWPACYHERPTMSERFSAEAAVSPAVEVARGAHRVAASTVLVVVIVLLVLSLGPRPYLQREGRHAMALLLLAVFLAVLGRWSSGAPSPGVVLGNLLGGFLMFALCVRLALPNTAHSGSSYESSHGMELNLALGLVLLQVAGGAVGHPLHRYAAVAVALGVGWLALQHLRRGARGVAVVLALLLSLQLALGLAQFALGLPLAMVLAHNVTAMLLLTVLLRLKTLPLLDGPPTTRP